MTCTERYANLIIYLERCKIERSFSVLWSGRAKEYKVNLFITDDVLRTKYKGSTLLNVEVLKFSRQQNSITSSRADSHLQSVANDLVNPTETPWRWGRIQSLKQRRNFTPWRGCLPENILLHSVKFIHSCSKLAVYIFFLYHQTAIEVLVSSCCCVY
jgi:hypothetical protein